MLRTINSWLIKLGKMIDKLFLFLGVILMAILFISCGLQVFSRYILNDSFSWTEEISRYTFVWVTLIGAVIATSEGAHCVVTSLENLFKGRVRYIQRVFVILCILVGGLVMLTQGIKMVAATMKTLSIYLRIPMGLVYMSVPVSGFGIVVHQITELLSLIAPEEGGEKQ